jgi:hypothetical protein
MATDKCPEYFRRNRMVTAGFVMNAGSSSGILRLPPENSAAICREEYKNGLFRLIYFKTGS